jgi:hypothetical protein
MAGENMIKQMSPFNHKDACLFVYTLFDPERTKNDLNQYI